MANLQRGGLKPNLLNELTEQGISMSTVYDFNRDDPIQIVWDLFSPASNQISTLVTEVSRSLQNSTWEFNR